MHSLPSAPDKATFRAWRSDPSNWLTAALDIARHEGLSYADPKPFLTGTNLVVALNQTLVLKIFPPFLRSQFLSERASLSQLRGRVSIPIPEIVREGERDQWRYLVITHLHGVLGAEAWPGLTEGAKERVLRQIGATIAEVQRAPLGELADIEPRWDPFLRLQIEGCRARHTRLGLAGKFLDGLDDFLAAAVPLIPTNAPPVILTGEYIPENFLLRQSADGWQLSALIDFGDVLAGWGEYDLLGPSAFMAAGMPRRVQSLFDGYGYSAADIGPELKRRLMALMLLHRASDPVRHIPIEGWQERADNLFELSELLWPV